MVPGFSPGHSGLCGLWNPYCSRAGNWRPGIPLVESRSAGRATNLRLIRIENSGHFIPVFNRGLGREVRHTLGARIAAHAPADTGTSTMILEYDVEGACQFGSFAAGVSELGPFPQIAGWCIPKSVSNLVLGCGRTSQAEIPTRIAPLCRRPMLYSQLATILAFSTTRDLARQTCEICIRAFASDLRQGSGSWRTGSFGGDRVFRTGSMEFRAICWRRVRTALALSGVVPVSKWFGRSTDTLTCSWTMESSSRVSPAGGRKAPQPQLRISPGRLSILAGQGVFRCASLLRQVFDHGKSRHECLWNIVPYLKITGAAIGQPNHPCTVLRNEELKRKIEGCAWHGDHDRRPRIRIAEDQELGIGHVQSRLLGFAAMVDQGK